LSITRRTTSSAEERAEKTTCGGGHVSRGVDRVQEQVRDGAADPPQVELGLEAGRDVDGERRLRAAQRGEPEFDLRAQPLRVDAHAVEVHVAAHERERVLEQIERPLQLPPEVAHQEPLFVRGEAGGLVVQHGLRDHLGRADGVADVVHAPGRCSARLRA